MKYAVAFTACLLLLATTAGAEPTARAVSWDNVHIRVADPAKAAEWYVTVLGAAPSNPPAPGTAQVTFGSIVITIVKTEEKKPSAGSLIDHIGLSYADISERLKRAQGAGATVISEVKMSPGIFRFAYIEDPWGVKIELVEDTERAGFHHVHLRVKNPETTLAWYQQHFGGERAKLRDKVDGVRYDGVWLFAMSSGNDTPASSSDHAIQNIALRVKDVDAGMKALGAAGVKTAGEPRSLPGMRYGFVEDPNGIRVELMDRSAGK
jgi:catechol 2,3-dioxygenase-like lactoylglutathione lyase family enzyme